MANTLNGFDLKDLAWEGERSWSPVEAVVETSLSGKPIRYERVRAGRPIDLAGGEASAWFTTLELDELRALAAVPGASWPLVFDGRAMTVRFRHEDGALEAEALRPGPGQEPGDLWHSVVLRLQEL